MTGSLFTVAAPSGAGKTSLVKAAVAADPELEVSISHTTRAIRNGETDGIDYHFVEHATFATMIEQNALLEYAEVFQHYYGTSKAGVDKQLQSGLDVVLEIDWQGAAQVKQLFPDTIAIFILPPSRDALLQRLQNRGRDDDATIAKRMAAAEAEMSHYTASDYLLINDDFEQTLQQLQTIITSARLRQQQQQRRYSELINTLLKDRTP